MIPTNLSSNICKAPGEVEASNIVFEMETKILFSDMLVQQA
jgi:hypothetical protein